MDDAVETLARALATEYFQGRGDADDWRWDAPGRDNHREQWCVQARKLLAEITPMLVVAKTPTKATNLLSADDMDRLIYRLTGDSGNWEEIRKAVDGLAASGVCRARPAPPAIGEGRG